MSVSQFDQLAGLALWVRAAAGIEATGDRLVPGPLDADDVPAPDAPAGSALGEEWIGWWRAILMAPHAVRGGDFPGADGLTEAPGLHDLVAARWREALEWHSARKRRELAAHPPGDLRSTEVVAEFERRAGRRARGFHASFEVIPVRDDVIRRIDGEHYLVPERVYLSRRWRVWLAGLVDRLA
ncbi:hypothetical protein [Dactylosporangium sp. CA-092794]|uniref:hypothetical protein n=1 Tax=Dactylosporangium sp. CA-092794 TaxID=3239929 RepID=UPI003D9067A4